MVTPSNSMTTPSQFMVKSYIQSNSEAYHFALLRSIQIVGTILPCGHATVDHQNQSRNTNMISGIYVRGEKALDMIFSIAFCNTIFIKPTQNMMHAGYNIEKHFKCRKSCFSIG